MLLKNTNILKVSKSWSNYITLFWETNDSNWKFLYGVSFSEQYFSTNSSGTTKVHPTAGHSLWRQEGPESTDSVIKQFQHGAHK